jgi:hypothetical protein
MERHFPEANVSPRNDPAMKSEPSLVEDDEKSGIVGATICFTPEHSPRASPRVFGDATMNSSSTNYIGSVADELGGEKLGSSAMHIASSLDDRSTTEYELLDGIESKGSVEVEDLDLEEDEVAGDLLATDGTINPDEKFDAALERFLESSLPSVTGDGDAVQENLELPASEEESLTINESGDDTAFSRMTKCMLTHMSKLGAQDVASVDGDAGSIKPVNAEEVAPNASSAKVDSTPLSTLKILKAFWESRLLGKTKEANVDGLEKQDQSVDALDSHSVGLNSQASSKGTTQASTRQDAASFLLSTVSFLSTIGLALWLWVQRALLACAIRAKQLIDVVCRSLGRNIISATTEPATGFAEIEADEEYEADLDDAVDPSRLNLNSLFGDDALGERKSALDEPVGCVTSIEDASSQANSARLGWKGYVISALAMLAVVWRFVARFYSAIESADGGAEHVCLTTNTTTYDSIPTWEINLSPSEHVSSSLPMLFVFTSIVVALITACVTKPGVLKHLSKLPFKKTKQLRGIWTAEEHEQFIRGFELHGTNWKLVAPFIPTRK